MIYRLSDMQRIAHDGHYAIPHFLGCTLEMTYGAIKAAERLNAPIALGVAPEVFSCFPMEFIFPMLLAVAGNAAVPVAVQLEHGNSYEQVVRALKLGVNSVMFDGSGLEYDENVEISKKVSDLAHLFDTCTEAELGHVGGSAIRNVTEGLESHMTDPELVPDFIARTGIDTLAISFGNVHGQYHGKPCIDLELVREIDRIAGIPLVMHGGSGLSDEIYPEIVRAGISNIHFYTGVCMTARDYIVQKTQDLKYPPYHEISGHLVNFFEEKTAHIIELLGARDKAGDFK